jgi:signal transduction histidine kinase
MDRIVARYELEARGRVVWLRRVEIALLALVLAVLALIATFVFRPAVRSLRRYLADRDEAQQAMLQISDREQQRIAQDLHDGLGQHLVGVSFLVRTLRQELAGDPREARVDEIERLLGESIEQTRGLVRSLHPHTLEAEGLVAALRELAAHTERVYGVECRIAVDGAAPDVAMSVRGHLYRIVREAVINAAKHAKASSIAIELSAGQIVVRDDGIGIGTPSHQGIGLRLMASRAKMIGASFALSTAEPRGTKVICSLPP